MLCDDRPPFVIWLNSSIIRFFLVDLLHRNLNILTLRQVAVSFSTFILKAYFVGSLTVTIITAITVVTSEALIISVLLGVFFGVSLFLGLDKEFLANGRVASSAALGVLEAHLGTLAVAIDLTRLISF